MEKKKEKIKGFVRAEGDGRVVISEIGEDPPEVEECEYCGKTFCKKHIKALPPSPPLFKDPTVNRKEWAEGGHRAQNIPNI